MVTEYYYTADQQTWYRITRNDHGIVSADQAEVITSADNDKKPLTGHIGEWQPITELDSIKGTIYRYSSDSALNAKACGVAKARYFDIVPTPGAAAAASPATVHPTELHHYIVLFREKIKAILDAGAESDQALKAFAEKLDALEYARFQTAIATLNSKEKTDFRLALGAVLIATWTQQTGKSSEEDFKRDLGTFKQFMQHATLHRIVEAERDALGDLSSQNTAQFTDPHYWYTIDDVHSLLRAQGTLASNISNEWADSLSGDTHRYFAPVLAQRDLTPGHIFKEFYNYLRAGTSGVVKNRRFGFLINKGNNHWTSVGVDCTDVNQEKLDELNLLLKPLEHLANDVVVSALFFDHGESIRQITAVTKLTALELEALKENICKKIAEVYGKVTVTYRDTLQGAKLPANLTTAFQGIYGKQCAVINAKVDPQPDGSSCGPFSIFHLTNHVEGKSSKVSEDRVAFAAKLRKDQQAMLMGALATQAQAKKASTKKAEPSATADAKKDDSASKPSMAKMRRPEPIPSAPPKMMKEAWKHSLPDFNYIEEKGVMQLRRMVKHDKKTEAVEVNVDAKGNTRYLGPLDDSMLDKMVEAFIKGQLYRLGYKQEDVEQQYASGNYKRLKLVADIKSSSPVIGDKLTQKAKAKGIAIKGQAPAPEAAEPASEPEASTIPGAKPT